MMLTLAPAAMAEGGGESGTPVTNSTCGAEGVNVQWSFDSSTGTLKIFGKGAMADFGNFQDSDGSYIKNAKYESSPQYDSRKLIYYVGTKTYVSDTPWKDLGTAVKSIVISEGVTHVGMRAFRLPCVESITIADSVTSIGAMAFDSEPELTTVNWDGNWSLEGHAAMKFDGFGSCDKLGEGQEFSAWLPDCFTSMNGQTINGSAFSVDFDKLNAQLKDQTDGYGSSAFQNMPNLKTAKLDSRFGTNAFSGSGIETLTISSDLTVIPAYTCENCTSLTSVVIPSSVTSVGDAAFRNSGLTSLTFEGDHAIAFGTQAQAFVKNNNSPKLTNLKLSENMSISDGNAIVSYLKSVGAVIDETTIEPFKFANVLTTKLTVDGSLGKEITRKNYPNVTELVIKGDSYVSADSAFSVTPGGTGKLKTLEIDVTGTATINETAFIRESLGSVKISASNLTLTGDAAFLNNSALSHIDLTGVQTITADKATRTFHIDGGSTESDLDRYVYLNDAACCQALRNLLAVDSSKGTSTCLITNGGTVTGSDGMFSAVTKPGYTATWYVYDQNKSDNHGTQVKKGNLPTKGTTYIVEWNLDSANYVEVTYQDGYADGSGVKETVAKSGGTLAGENIFTRAGYTLTGWKVENGEDSYKPGATVNPSENMTLVAQWTLDKPTISGPATAVYGNEVVTLTASTEATGASYQWYKDDAAIADEANSRLTLTDVADSGAYTVEITVGNDTATSESKTVTIAKATPTIDISADQTSLTGSGTVKLTVTGAPTTEGTVTVTCGENTYTPSLENGKYVVTIDLPNETKDYDVTASYTAEENGNYENAQSNACKVSVTRRSSSSGRSSDPTYSVTTPSKSENGSVTVSPKHAGKGDRVSVTVKPDKGYVLETLTVIDKNGDELKLTDKGDSKYTFTMPDGKVEVKATFTEDNTMLNFFVDVKAGDYYYDAVLWAAQNGVTSGTDAVHFNPGAPCTRAQIVTFLWRAAGSPEPKGTAAALTDVLSGSYYEKAVAWAIENGITTGTDEGKFSPDATCTRAQAVTFLARALGAKASGKAEFSDVPADSYFADAVAWALSNGVTDGIGGGLFAPGNDCTRAQIVTFLFRAYNK